MKINRQGKVKIGYNIQAIKEIKMSDNSSSSSSSGIGLGGLIFIVFLVMKLTEKLSFWGDNFPRFLKSTDAWWDGWFMVFLPLWGGFVIAAVLLIIGIGIANLVNHKNF